MSTHANQFDPVASFPGFYLNPAIKSLAAARRWTISGQIGDDSDSTNKAPIDIKHLLKAGRVRGAWATDDQCLVTLGELTAAIPLANNTAFYVQAQTDGLMVLDIEKHCPPHIAGQLLQLPGVLYREVSMSGLGFHLVMELPGNFDDYPIAATKRRLSHPDNWYEILLDHWATFTRTPVDAARSTVMQQHAASQPKPETFDSIESLYADLAVHARQAATTSPNAISTSAEMPEITDADEIITDALRNAIASLRAPTDFNHDLSRWEFSVLAVLYRFIKSEINTREVFGLNYTSDETAWLLYRAAEKVIPARAKHSQLRNNRPFLLDRAAALVAERQATLNLRT